MLQRLPRTLQRASAADLVRAGAIRAGIVAALPLSVAVVGCRVTSPPVAAPVLATLPAVTPTPALTPTPAVERRAPELPPTARPTRTTTARPSSLAYLPDRDVRVLIADSPTILLPDPGRRYRCEAGARSMLLRGPLIARQDSVRFGVQAGAFASAANARRRASELGNAGFEASVQEAPGGFHRVVVVGRDGEAANAFSDRLARAGVRDTTRPVATTGRLTVEGEGGARFSGERITVTPLDPDPVRYGERRFRGSLVLAPAAAGVRLIDVLPLETYLRGVVPAEMGPRAFPAIEALKAQAVAARTYTIAHLGERDAEGYDICATQACQVYEGVGAEHPLTDRAIAETAGEVLVHEGVAIDAMYHSTCAGHTEDAAVVLPERAAPYLVGVPCRGEQELRLGALPAGPWLGEVERLGLVADSISKALGAGETTAESFAASLTGRPSTGGVRGLVWTFGLDEALAMLHGVERLGEEERVLHLLETFRLPLTPPLAEQDDGAWRLALALRLAQVAGRVEAFEGRIVPSPTGPRLVFDRGEENRELGGHELILERRAGAWRQTEVVFPAGSDATLWCVQGGACPVVEIEPRFEADDRSAWGWWIREIDLTEMGRRLGVRGVRDVEVLRRGHSGRAASVSVVGESGAVEIGGYRFRMSLGLPDTLFVVALRQTPGGPVAHFVGRGWGHGIGMCQNGAFGLARGGADHEQILTWYYTGAVLAAPNGRTGGVDE